MEGDHRHNASGLYHGEHILHRLPEAVQLAVDLTADRLKASFAGITARSAGSCRNTARYDIRQLKRGADRRFFTLGNDAPRDAFGEFFFAVSEKDTGERCFIVGVHHVVSGQAVFRHTHIQRPVEAIRKAALRVIELIAAHTEIGKHTVNGLVRHLGQKLLYVKKITVKNGHVLFPGETLLQIFNRIGIPVDADQPTAFGKPFEDRRGMTALAHGAIYIRSVGIDFQRIDTLVQQYGNVKKFHGSAPLIFDLRVSVHRDRVTVAELAHIDLFIPDLHAFSHAENDYVAF